MPVLGVLLAHLSALRVHREYADVLRVCHHPRCLAQLGEDGLGGLARIEVRGELEQLACRQPRALNLGLGLGVEEADTRVLDEHRKQVHVQLVGALTEGTDLHHAPQPVYVPLGRHRVLAREGDGEASGLDHSACRRISTRPLPVRARRELDVGHILHAGMASVLPWRLGFSQRRRAWLALLGLLSLLVPVISHQVASNRLRAFQILLLRRIENLLTLQEALAHGFAGDF
mmetsp:Transcript_39529/g.105059  ORF Transcript_39529/g.105059 Transcript_39529/m.105059 type:complete len:230 (-) Transcript_39529:2164-2853(-)